MEDGELDHEANTEAPSMYSIDMRLLACIQARLEDVGSPLDTSISRLPFYRTLHVLNRCVGPHRNLKNQMTMELHEHLSNEQHAS